MTSKIEIVNIALSMCRANHIGSFDENSSEAFHISTAYEPIFASLLERHPWSFATKVANLAQLDEDPYDFAYVYQLPADCMKPQGTIHNLNEQPDYKVRGRKFYSDENPCVLEYTYQIENTGHFHPTFVVALAAAIAAHVAPALGGEKMQGNLVRLAAAYLKTAQASDANTMRVKPTTNRTYVSVRS